MSIELSESEIIELRNSHRQLKNKRDAKNAYRVNTIILLAMKYSYVEVAEILLLDETTIRCERKAKRNPMRFSYSQMQSPKYNSKPASQLVVFLNFNVLYCYENQYLQLQRLKAKKQSGLTFGFS